MQAMVWSTAGGAAAGGPAAAVISSRAADACTARPADVGSNTAALLGGKDGSSGSLSGVHGGTCDGPLILTGSMAAVEAASGTAAAHWKQRTGVILPETLAARCPSGKTAAETTAISAAYCAGTLLDAGSIGDHAGQQRLVEDSPSPDIHAALSTAALFHFAGTLE